MIETKNVAKRLIRRRNTKTGRESMKAVHVWLVESTGP